MCFRALASLLLDVSTSWTVTGLMEIARWEPPLLVLPPNPRMLKGNEKEENIFTDTREKKGGIESWGMCLSKDV